MITFGMISTKLPHPHIGYCVPEVLSFGEMLPKIRLRHEESHGPGVFVSSES